MDEVGKYTLQVMKLAGWYNNWLFSFVKPHLKGEILEVGYGIGNFTNLLSKEGKVTAIDIDKSYIDGLKNKRDIKVGFGNIEKGKYFFSKKKFDIVICMNVLEHIKKDDEGLKNMYRLLKKDGKLIILVPAFKFAYGTMDENLGHYRRYSKNELEDKLVNVGFKINNTRFLNFLGIWGWFLNSRLLEKKVISGNQLKIFDLISRPFLHFEKLLDVPMGLSIFAIAEK